MVFGKALLNKMASQMINLVYDVGALIMKDQRDNVVRSMVFVWAKVKATRL